VREAVNTGRADFTPVFLSDIPALFSNGTLPLDLALLQVSPPDEHGRCSLGVSVDVALAAAHSARRVVAEVNARMPRTLGHTTIHVDEIDGFIEIDRSIREVPPRPVTDVHRAIAAHVAELVDDGSTLQIGIGAAPDAVLAALRDHRDLGVHTEMFSDSVVDLVEAGIVTGACKRLHPGQVVSSFVMGSRRLYDFVDEEPTVLMLPANETNDISVIAA
jgi:acyl-CoA hydrolase